MAQVIIGHTTETTTRIWVQGQKCRWCEIAVALESSEEWSTRRIALSSHRGYAGTTDFSGLRAGSGYVVRTTFAADPDHPVYGGFRTMVRPVKEFSFVLSSCNLSVISINNLLARLVASGGIAAANASLGLARERWKCRWLHWTRKPLQCLLNGVGWLITAGTGMKQPGAPRIRSPFLKLNAVFDAWVLRVVACRKDLPAVGDIVATEQGGVGVLACGATEAEDLPAALQAKQCEWLLVLAQTEGTIEGSKMAFKRAAGAPKADDKLVGAVQQTWKAAPWHEKPAFFLHAGDQIYYDFPTAGRKPDRDQYRLAYQEAWSDDESNRYLLSHWPHYMTLDDHEIADQFARDFQPPAKNASVHDYLREARIVYGEYVHSRNPGPSVDPHGPGADDDQYWYKFDKGRAKFFVLDTRLRREDRVSADGRSTQGQIIDKKQMEELLAWMKRYRNDLKFVVTSVPFVAQIKERLAKEGRDWFAENHPADKQYAGIRQPAPTDRRTNPTNDTWSAERFRSQRNQIINYVADERIERLVFLAGDMHCCYHATMRIGTESKYECTTVHELASGPVNQLQLADFTDFATRHTGQAGASRYEIVLDQFHGEVNAVMHLKVGYATREEAGAAEDTDVPEIEWNVIRTLTDAGAFAWASPPKKDQQQTRADAMPSGSRVVERTIKTREDEPTRLHEPTMSGRISFVRRRRPADLQPWPSPAATESLGAL